MLLSLKFRFREIKDLFRVTNSKSEPWCAHLHTKVNEFTFLFPFCLLATDADRCKPL